MIKNTSIKALLKLMDDSDRFVREHAIHTLMEQGDDIIPEIERLEENTYGDPLKNDKIKTILKELKFQSLKRNLALWKCSPEKNLIEAIHILCTYQFPELRMGEFLEKFQALNYQCWLKIHAKQTNFEKVSVLNRIFFQEFGFTTIKTVPATPFDLFVNAVLDTREGTDLALGIIYSIIAQSIGLPIYGVTTLNSRAPFVLAYLDSNHLLPILDWGIHNNGVLFYINMLENGEIIDPKRLQSLYEVEGLPQNRAQFEPTANTLIIKRFLIDIQRAYSNHPQYRYKLNDIKELISIFD